MAGVHPSKPELFTWVCTGYQGVWDALKTTHSLVVG